MKTMNHRRVDGFTLIEILVALAIFGLVVTAIYSGWMAILRASRTGLEAAAQAQRERIAIHTIEEALTSARSFAADLQHYGFVGQNGSEATLSFVAQLPKSFPRSGRFGDFDVRRVIFSVESGQDSQRQLVLRQSPILMEFDQDEREHPLVLAKNVKELGLEFWNAAANEWTEEWNQTNSLPKMVKVTLRLTPPNQRYYSSRVQEEITRIVALPAVTVPANWQTPPRTGAGQPGTGRAGVPGVSGVPGVPVRAGGNR
jgi:general secretion pathway protein J